MEVPILTLKKQNVCEIGRGVYGKVCKYNNVKWKSYAVKCR